MRYRNYTTRASYCSGAGRLMNPGSCTGKFDTFAKFLDGLAKGAGICSIQLEKEDMAAIERFCRKLSRPDAAALAKMKEAMKDPLSSRQVYEGSDAKYIAKQERVSKLIKDHAEKEARINAESNFILPDGTPVGKEDDEASGFRVKNATTVEPRIVERPASPLDILAHNAKVSTERAQYKPLSGKEAVLARKGAPGMPNLPGIEEHMKTLAQEEAMAQAMKSGIPVNLSTDMIAKAKENNYGRK